MMRANGFTLIELLAAMVAGSLLLMSLTWATGSINRHARPSDRERETADVAVLARTLTRLIHAGLPEDDGQAFEVSADRLSGVIAPPQALGASGPVRVALASQKEADGVALYATFAPLDADEPLPEAAQTPMKLASGFRSFRFEADESEDNALPQRVTLIVEGIERRTITAATRMTSGGACQFDVISGACR
jgi:prepilin-type N-terminal cleavage/methylation domain-containing protein